MASKRPYAPGIPGRETKPIRPVTSEGPNEVWVLGVEHHQAKRAGTHYDLRLVDPKTGYAHSWAIPEARLPKPGEKVLAKRTWTHDMEYAMRTGQWELGPGYGEGKVTKKILEPVEVIKADDRHVRFNRYGPGQRVEEYSIISTPKADILYNHTLAGELGLPRNRGKYKDTKPDLLDPTDKDELWMAKIDGAHAVVYLPKSGKQARVFSVRRSKRNESLIEHTPRFQDWNKLKTPPGYGGTVLRAELWGTDRQGKAIPPQTLAGLLNTSVWNARLKQEDQGYRLRLAPFDVVRWKGKDVANKPFEERLKMIDEVSKQLPNYVEPPPMAKSTTAKKRLLERIRTGKEKATHEGVVIRRLKDNAPPTRAKFRQEEDATVIGYKPGQGKWAGGKGVGGLIVKDNKTGTTSVVGTGLPDRLRKALVEDPELAKGMIAKVEVQQVFPSGKYRAPVFRGWHLDKNDPKKLERIQAVTRGG